MKLTLHAFDLRLRHTFTIARGSLDVQPTLIVELEQAGCRGYGEATTNAYYGATLESMSAALGAVAERLAEYELGVVGSKDGMEGRERLDRGSGGELLK